MHPKLAPALNFTQIKQASNEPFIDFIDKLRVAVEKQVEDIKKKRLMITSIAKANANDVCKGDHEPPFRATTHVNSHDSSLHTASAGQQFGYQFSI